MRWTEIDRPPLTGEFNINVFVTDYIPALMRVPRPNPSMLESLIHEYRALGFIGDGGRIRLRTPEEQYVWSRTAAMKGLRVLPPLSLEQGKVHNPYLPQAQTLDVFFAHANTQNGNAVIYQIFADLYLAHNLGFIYGDRWAGNMLVGPKYGLTHIDFDIDISGSHARELDIAQVTYHTLWSGKEPVASTIIHNLLTHPDWFDVKKMISYLRGFSRYLNQTKVGGMEDATAGLIDTLCALHLAKLT